MVQDNTNTNLPVPPNPAPRVAAFLLLIILLATAAILNRKGQSNQPAPGNQQGVTSIDLKAAQAKYGFGFQEVAKQAGINFTHHPPQLDPKLNHIMPEIAAMGASVSVVDFDRDGWNDFYVTDSGENMPNHLYHNNHDGTFTDVAAQMGVADLNKTGTGASMGAIWGDFDGDGWEDLLVYKWGKSELFHNDGGKGFTRVTDKAGLPAWANINSAVWLDYDRDGHLDLLLCGYYPEDVDLWHLKNTRMMPDSFEYAQNGGRKYLLRNKGDGTFEDVTARVGLNSHRWTLAAVAADLRGTGYPDIVLSNDYGITEYFLNHEGKSFEEVSSKVMYYDKFGTGPKSGMNASIGDVLNQNQFALYISNISEQGQLIQGNNLWIREQTKDEGGRMKDDANSHSSFILHPSSLPKYANMAHDMGVELGGWSFGAQFGDLNNDGNLDLYLTNGYISADRDKSYWYDFGKVSGGNTAIISDAANWPALNNRSHSGYQPKCVWLNDGAGKFTEVAQQVGATDRYDGRSVALADLWNRGQLDVIVANQRGPLLIYKNNVVPENQWVEFDLDGKWKMEKGEGFLPSYLSPIGAQISLTWNGQTQLQEVLGGSGFCAQNQRRLHFGLGKNARLEKAAIRWPDGTTQILTPTTKPALEAGKIITVNEG